MSKLLPDIKIIRTVKGDSIKVVIPSSIAFEDYVIIMDDSAKVDKDGTPQIKIFNSHLDALLRTVKDELGKVVPWKQIDSRDAIKCYELIEKFFLAGEDIAIEENESSTS